MGHRLRRLVAATVLAAPLVAVPAVAPAAVATVDHPGISYGDTYSADTAYGYGGAAPFGYGPYGGYGGYGGAPGTSATTTTGLDAETASTAEATGVVLIDTQLDYGTGEAAGTGLVLTSDGVVLTNHHVIADSTSIQVTVPSTGTSYQADVVGYDATDDVAVLRLEDASGLATVTTDRDPIAAGAEVTSVGNAEGGGTLMAADGTVTALGSDITVSDDDGGSERLQDLIEVDADIVSGDSGGALLDDTGEVVGMNVAASSGSASITGYAIPIDTVLDVAADILAGTTTGDIELGYDAALGVQLDTAGGTPTVAGVVDGGAAEDAGITAGSTITSVDGTSTTSADQLSTAVRAHDAGDRVTVGWTDGSGEPHTATVTLGRAPVA